MCRDYSTGETPDFKVEISQSDIDFEREKSAMENKLEGIAVINYPNSYLETLAVYRKITDKLNEFDTILFHGSCIAIDGEGYLFTAKSGTGKSTHTRLWREVFGEKAVMVNDDKPLIKITDSGAEIFGTPWNGKHKLGSNISVPLKAICILERGAENVIKNISKSEAFPLLLQQVQRSADKVKLSKTIGLVNKMGDKVNLYKLWCNMEREAAEISYNAMRRGKNEA